MKSILFLCLILAVATAFAPRPTLPRGSSTALEWNPLKDLGDFVANLDDVLDDFMNKRMGNGEVFYGKRKYKPSGRPNTQGDYQGMGLSDKLRIDVSRQFKEDFQEQRRRAQQDKE